MLSPMIHSRCHRAILATAVTLLLLPGAAMANLVVNPGFEEGTGTYTRGSTQPNVINGPAPWQFELEPDTSAILGAPLAPAVNPRSGENVLYFSDLDTGFGDNKAEQCIPVDATRQFEHTVWINVTVANDDLRVRLNPNFYETLAQCEDWDSNDGRLTNEDYDFELRSGAGDAGSFGSVLEPGPMEAGAWYRLGMMMSQAEMQAEAEDAQFVRISIRARNRSDESGANVYFDDVGVWQTAAPMFEDSGDGIVTLSSATPGATILYTLDGSDPQAPASPDQSGTGEQLTSNGIVNITDSDQVIRALAYEVVDETVYASYVTAFEPSHVPPPPPPEQDTATLSCSMGQGAKDPLFPLLAIGAVLYLVARARSKRGKTSHQF